MWHDIWVKKSIRFWVAVSMGLAIVPLTVSAVVGYLVLKHGVLDAFKDVAARQHNQIKVVQLLQLSLWEGSNHVDLYVADGSPAETGAYRLVRQQIEAQFVRLHAELKAEPEAQTLLERARVDWSAADRLAAQLLSINRAGVTSNAAPIDQFENLIASASDKLAAIRNELDTALTGDYQSALLAYERSEWIAGIAAAASLLLIIASVWMIEYILVGSIDRLLAGTARFRSGDRDFRVEIAIPPELNRVADEFNRMIVQIHQSELAMTDLARRDKLTGLLNRRAFDETLTEALARLQRLHEPFALFMLDLDHFKRINDTYGHASGDDVLRMAAQAMSSSLRTIDKAFRVGGEEFAVLLPSADATTARTAADRLRDTIAAGSVKAGSNEIRVTASVGIALASPQGTAEALIKRADAALYQAKAGGRNRIVLNEETEA